MPLADFTGADLRDWHREHATPEAHQRMADTFEASEGMLSWEAVARGLRRALGDELLDTVAVPVMLEVVLDLYVVAFCDGARATNDAWREVAPEPQGRNPWAW